MGEANTLFSTPITSLEIKGSREHSSKTMILAQTPHFINGKLRLRSGTRLFCYMVVELELETRFFGFRSPHSSQFIPKGTRPQWWGHWTGGRTTCDCEPRCGSHICLSLLLWDSTKPSGKSGEVYACLLFLMKNESLVSLRKKQNFLFEFSHKESTCQCRRRRFDPGVRKIH